jgi:pimeloyl-ACP methyl ester carboxylesterase
MSEVKPATREYLFELDAVDLVIDEDLSADHPLIRIDEPGSCDSLRAIDAPVHTAAVPIHVSPSRCVDVDAFALAANRVDRLDMTIIMYDKDETVHGVRTHYSYAGSGEPLVLVHGGGPGASGASGWASTIPELAKKFKVYAIDLIGNGQTDKPMIEYSLQTLVEHVAGFIDALNLKQVRICGNSQGAYVATKYTLDNPGRVKSLAILSTGNLATACGIADGPNRTPLPRFDGSKESLRKFIGVIVNDPSKITDELIDSRHAVATLPGHQEMLQSIQRHRKLALENPSHHQAWFIRDRMKELKIPYCFIWGGDDRSAPLDPLGLGLKALLPDAPFHVVKGSGHQVQNDKPEECNRLLMEHFTKH